MGIYCGEPISFGDMLINILHQQRTKSKRQCHKHEEEMKSRSKLFQTELNKSLYAQEEEEEYEGLMLSA